MTATAASLPKARWKILLHSPETLADDLGSIGCWVGLRTTAPFRKSGEKEDFALRRLLVAWKQVGGLSWPVEVEASATSQNDRMPDFIVHLPTGETLAIEVVGAGTHDSYEHFTENEVKRKGHRFWGPSSAVPNAFIEQIRKKARKDQGKQMTHCDLVILDETHGYTGLDHIRDAIRSVEFDKPVFRQIHIVRGYLVDLNVLHGNTQPIDLSKSYEIDYAQWIFDQIEQLRKGNVGGVDATHVAEELADLGRAERNSLVSHLEILLLHLLKWKLQVAMRSSSWKSSIRNSRNEIERLLEGSPSLKRILDAEFSSSGAGFGKAYRHARELASDETGLSLDVFPAVCPFSLEQVIDKGFFPER